MSLLFRPLDLALSSSSKVRVLRALHHAAGAVSGREAAALAGVGVHPAQRALFELVALGIVRQENARSQHLYTLNRENELVRRALAPVFKAEEARVAEVFDALRKAVTRFESGARPRLKGLYLFGSAARGRDVAGSDLDVLAVVAAPRDVDTVHENLAEHAPEVYSRYGLRLSALVLDLEKLRAMHANGDALTKGLLAENRRITGTRL